MAIRRTAGKEHECVQCHKRIRKGEICYRTSCTSNDRKYIKKYKCDSCCKNGYTPTPESRERQRAFLAAYRKLGSINKALTETGIHREVFYTWKGEFSFAQQVEEIRMTWFRVTGLRRRIKALGDQKWEFYRATIKLTTRCFHCNRLIQSGQLYVHFTSAKVYHPECCAEQLDEERRMESA